VGAWCGRAGRNAVLYCFAVMAGRFVKQLVDN
jgi:hypothetical protein